MSKRTLSKIFKRAESNTAYHHLFHYLEVTKQKFRAWIMKVCNNSGSRSIVASWCIPKDGNEFMGEKQDGENHSRYAGHTFMTCTWVLDECCLIMQKLCKEIIVLFTNHKIIKALTWQDKEHLSTNYPAHCHGQTMQGTDKEKPGITGVHGKSHCSHSNCENKCTQYRKAVPLIQYQRSCWQCNQCRVYYDHNFCDLNANEPNNLQLSNQSIKGRRSPN